MKLYKQIEIPLEQYRAQLTDATYNYSNHEKSKLKVLYDLFEQGKFRDCVDFSAIWSRSDRELIPQDIWDVLFDVSMGCDHYKI